MSVKKFLYSTEVKSPYLKQPASQSWSCVRELPPRRHRKTFFSLGKFIQSCYKISTSVAIYSSEGKNNNISIKKVTNSAFPIFNVLLLTSSTKISIWVTHQIVLLLMRLMGFSNFTLNLKLRHFKERFLPQIQKNYMSTVSV